MKKIRWVVEKKDQDDKIYIFRTLEGIIKYFNLNIHTGTLLYQINKAKHNKNNKFNFKLFDIKKVSADQIDDLKQNYSNKHIIFVHDDP